MVELVERAVVPKESHQTYLQLVADLGIRYRAALALWVLPEEGYMAEAEIVGRFRDLYRGTALEYTHEDNIMLACRGMVGTWVEEDGQGGYGLTQFGREVGREAEALKLWLEWQGLDPYAILGHNMANFEGLLFTRIRAELLGRFAKSPSGEWNIRRLAAEIEVDKNSLRDVMFGLGEMGAIVCEPVNGGGEAIQAESVYRRVDGFTKGIRHTKRFWWNGMPEVIDVCEQFLPDEEISSEAVCDCLPESMRIKWVTESVANREIRRILKELMQQGYLERVKIVDHKGQYRVNLTEMGERVVRELLQPLQNLVHGESKLGVLPEVMAHLADYLHLEAQLVWQATHPPQGRTGEERCQQLVGVLETGGSLTIGEIAQKMQMSASGVTGYARYLAEKGFVKVTIRGGQTHYSL